MISFETNHTTLEQLFTLVGGFAGVDGGHCEMIPGTHRLAKLLRRYWTPGHPVGDVDVIAKPHDASGRAP